MGSYILPGLFCELLSGVDRSLNFYCIMGIKTDDDTVVDILPLRYYHGNTTQCPEHYEEGPEVIKLFSCSTQLRLKFILLINVKMPTIVGI